MRALVRIAGVVMAAAVADVVLVAGFHLFDALDFVAVIFELVVDALAVAIAFDGFLGYWRGAGEVDEWLVGVFDGHSGVGCWAVVDRASQRDRGV